MDGLLKPIISILVVVSLALLSLAQMPVGIVSSSRNGKVSCAELTTSSSTTDNQATYATGSITPTANNLVLAWYQMDATSAQSGTDTPTAAGNSLTYVQVDTKVWQATSLSSLTLFRAMGASPTAGAITFTNPNNTGNNTTGAIWEVVQCSGTDTTGTNGSGAIAQEVNAKSASNGTTATVTLGPFANPYNATAGGLVHALNASATAIVLTAFSAGSGHATPVMHLDGEWKADNQTVVSMTIGSTAWAGIAVEIKSAP